MRRTWVTCLLGLTASASASAKAVQVHGDGVIYQGVTNKTSKINSFFGIKYAKSPSGDLRWKAPVPVESLPIGTIINATAPGPTCVQSAPPWGAGPNPDTSGEEDCLSLDILVPTNPASAKLPVVLQIHGGAYIAGSSTTLSGDAIVYQSEGKLIFVSIQYRLGPLGFLGGDEVGADGTANAGLLDQRFALEWVQKNIHYFGGDPSQVTITGGSAGGGSVSLQMILRGGDENPPFHAAIPEYPWWTPIYDDKWVERQYQGLLQGANCSSLSCLRSLPIEKIKLATQAAYQTAYANGEFAYGTFYWGPTVDGNIIQDYPRAEFANGHFSKVPVLVDRDGVEGTFFTNFSETGYEDVVADLSTLFRGAPKDFTEGLLSHYPASTYNSSWVHNIAAISAIENQEGVQFNFTDALAQRVALFGDATINCPSHFIASAVADAGVKTYKMVFNTGTQVHGATGYFVWSPTINPTGAVNFQGADVPGNATVAEYMLNYFASFAIYQDPNRLHSQDGRPHWPEFSKERQSVLDVEPQSIRVLDDPDANAVCKTLEGTKVDYYHI